MDRHLSETIGFLKEEQEEDGCFIGGAGKSIDSFNSIKTHPTVFFTSLIAWCLKDIKISEAEIIRKKSIEFLLRQKSDAWSWNYWIRDSEIAKKYPYPDDLDDTSRALMSIMTSSELDGYALARVAKLLIANEKKPGGPYRTWLVDKSLKYKWGDVDVAVNANIAALLKMNNALTPGLNMYVDDCIRNNKLDSPYYVGIIPTIYFLSGWYEGEHLNKLKRMIRENLSREINNPLMLSLLITSSVKTGAGGPIKRSIEKLVSLKNSNHWAAEAMYVDPEIDGVKYYAGSKALTSAFAVEAMNNYQNYIQDNYDKPRLKIIRQHDYLPIKHKDTPINIKKYYKAAAKKIVNNDRDGQICRMADITTEAYDGKVSSETIKYLNSASLNGWIAYGIYDDFLDNEGKPQQLGVANYALRRMVEDFNMALSEDNFFKRLVNTTLNKVDEANTWEIINARAIVKDNKLIYKLPRYANNHKLAEKSLGHMLAAIGAAKASGLSDKSFEIIELQKFFYHFLIARQLNDDAHDWIEDLTNGHLSPAVTILLRDYGKEDRVDLEEDMKGLKIHFWENSINQISELIITNIKKARTYLRKSGMRDFSVFESWLDSLADAAEQAQKDSRKSKQFIDSFH